jgi:leader peptidase (prepilin peptidase)/N-methyltransferase
LEAQRPTAQPVDIDRSLRSVADLQPTESDVSIATVWANSSSLQRIVCLASIIVAIATPTIAGVPIASGVAVAILVPAALIDLRTRRLPDLWVGAAAVAFLVVDALSRAIGTSGVAPRDILLGALVMSGPLLLMHLASPSSMGFGDVKLAVVAGAALGATDWHLALPALALAAGATATVGIVARARYLAFGPGLVGATLVALLMHDVLVRA